LFSFLKSKIHTSTVISRLKFNDCGTLLNEFNVHVCTYETTFELRLNDLAEMPLEPDSNFRKSLSLLDILG